MFAHVALRAELSRIVDRVVVLTDDAQVADASRALGIECQIVLGNFSCGTERVAAAILEEDEPDAIVVNGDEPLFNPNHVMIAFQRRQETGADMALLVRPFSTLDSASDFKVILNRQGFVQYISRTDIPHFLPSSGSRLKAYHIMAFSREALLAFATLPPSEMELNEGHEHLRLLDNGYRIAATIVNSSSISVDVAADVEYVNREMERDQFFPHYRHA